jgi:hypothetical protein
VSGCATAHCAAPRNKIQYNGGNSREPMSRAWVIVAVVTRSKVRLNLKMFNKLLIIITLIIAVPVFAQDAQTPPPQQPVFPCEDDEQFSEFDFWVGKWDVHIADGTLVGENLIKKAERGCVLVENWKSARGGTGMSINYFDKTTNEWVQIWNDASGSQINIRGGITSEGMLLEGTIHYVANGTTAPFRGLWTLLPDGRVRQFFEQSNDGGESWQGWFEGFYSRKE